MWPTHHPLQRAHWLPLLVGVEVSVVGAAEVEFWWAAIALENQLRLTLEIKLSWLCLAIRFTTSHVIHVPPAASRSLLFLVEVVVVVTVDVGCRGSQLHFQLQLEYNFDDVAAFTCQLTSALYRLRYRPQYTAPMGLR
jgi:hypothetical protein